MKVILMQDLKGRGTEGDIIEVARGFAVNYLLPRKVAVEATSGNLKQLEARRHNIAKREAARRNDAEGIAAALEGSTVVIEAKAGDEGRLYGSVTSQMIEDAILSQLSVQVDRKKMSVHGHIKTLGEHTVSVSLHRDVKADVVVNVIAEGSEPTAPAKAKAAVEESATGAAQAETAVQAEADAEPAAAEEPAAEQASTEVDTAADEGADDETEASAEDANE